MQEENPQNWKFAKKMVLMEQSGLPLRYNDVPGSKYMRKEESLMKKMMALLLCLMMVGILPAQAEENAGFTWETALIGQEIAGSSCELRYIYRLDVAKDGAPFQTLYFTRGEKMDDGIRLADMNFDGYPDLAILYYLGASNAAYTFFLYDPEIGEFACAGETGIFNWLSAYTLYPDRQLILNDIHDSALTGTTQLFRWEEGQLRLIREVEILHDPEDSQRLLLTVRESDGEWGELREIERRSYSVLDAVNSRVLDEDRETLLWQGI